MDATTGSARVCDPPSAEACPTCHGTGADPQTGRICGACNGLGDIHCRAPAKPYRPQRHRRPRSLRTRSPRCLTS
jgi:DnaJ-class molecular chaperone